MKLSQLRDVNNSIYYGIKYFNLTAEQFNSIESDELKKLYITFLNYCDNSELYENNRINRDGLESHITVLPVSDVGGIIKRYGEIEAANIFAKFDDFDFNDITFEGIGKAKKNGNETYFIVCKSQSLKVFNDSLNLLNKDYHITLGFDKYDVFGVDKSTVRYTYKNLSIKDVFKVFYKKIDSYEFLFTLPNFPTINAENFYITKCENDIIECVAGDDSGENKCVLLFTKNNDNIIVTKTELQDKEYIFLDEDIIFN